MKRLLLALGLGLMLTGCQVAREGGPATAYGPHIGFASPSLLHEHFVKHGPEFQARSEVEYLNMAQALRDKPLSPDVLEGRRKDEVVTRFDRPTRSFLAFDKDGTIRTFFKPNDGESYYWRQLNR